MTLRAVSINRGRVVWREAAAFARQTWLIPKATRGLREHAPSEHLTVFVHGYMASGGVFDPLARFLAVEGIAPRQLHFSYAPVGSVDALARRLETRIREINGDGPVRIVGHSLGGLIGRYYRQILRRPVESLVCLATPHSGTTRAPRWTPLPLAREIAPRSGTIQTLHDTRAALAGVRVCSLIAAHDTLVTPARNASLDGHENVAIEGVAHQSILFDHSAWTHVARVLSARVAA